MTLAVTVAGVGLFLAGFIAGALFIGQEVDLFIAGRHDDVHAWLRRRVNEGRRGLLFYLAVTVEFTVLHPREGVRLVGTKLAKLRRANHDAQ